MPRLLGSHAPRTIPREARKEKRRPGQRFHDTTGTGPLGGPQGDQPRARGSCTSAWHDGLGHSLFGANYGTVPVSKN